ncbi:MAG TPA: anthranilate phosphoribosyltransferase, partial [Thermoanaerobaculia bacterium]
LTNPAFARRQVLGVYSDDLVEVVARVLAALGTTHALVVHSRDGLDEIAVSAPTHVAEVRNGEVHAFEVTPETFGVATHPIEALAGGDAKTNAGIAREVLEGKGGAREDVVVVNAGAALYVGGRASSLREGAAQAREAIRSGAALRKLNDLVEASREQ